MKKRFLIIVFVFSLLAIAGGAYLVVAIGHNASHMQELIVLHQVEILREQLVLNIYQVQKDLYSLTTKFPESRDATMDHLSRVETAISECFRCHHTESVTERLTDLRDQIHQYSGDIKNVLAIRTDAAQFQRERDKAIIIGESLIAKGTTMIVLTNKLLSERTESALRGVGRSKTIVIILAVAGPLMVALFGFMSLTSFARPIQILLDAVKRLRSGDLDVRVTGLKDEFAELADSMNTMATALRSRMREITENERRYRLLFESAADAIFILDTEGDRSGAIVAANAAAAAMHGYAIDELTAMNIRDVDAPEAAGTAAERIARALDGEWIKAEINHVKKDGTAFPVEISAGVFEFDNHKYILAIDRDITERRRTEEALQRADQLRTTGELAAGLAHEIKNPLAGIKVTMEALAEESYITGEDRGILFKVIDEIKRIDGLIKGLLNFARPPKPQFMPTDVNAVLDAATLMIMQSRASSSGNGAPKIEVVKNLAADLPEIIIDPMQLKQVFVNLLMNAADAVPDSGTISVKTDFVETICAIRVAVSDNGKGIDAAELDRIFQPFFTTKAKGTGLGLAITKRLIEEQGGGIIVESRVGRGTTFSITLPCDGRKGKSRA